MESPDKVWIVVDPQFGERLTELPVGQPVWITDSLANGPVIRRRWEQRPARSHLTGLTSFKHDEGGSPEDRLLNILGTVDLHHGAYSAKPPYSVVEVVGCVPSEAIRSALDELGFHVESSDWESFVAMRNTS